MKILENVDLKPFTSMYVGGKAKYFVEVDNILDLKESLSFAKDKGINFFILGGGSNILVSDSGFHGLVIKISILGRDFVNETKEFNEYLVGAGENWDKFVKFTVDFGLYGIENMSHIPGTVGASVVQNIGCYGQEVSKSVISVNLIDTNSLEEIVLSKDEMDFSYRKSCLNNPDKDKGKYVVTSILFRLQKKGELNLKYDDLNKYFLNNKDIKPNLKNIREAIIKIRDAKFPYPNSPQNGTAGSFWNAEVVDENTYEEIIEKLRSKGFENKALEMENKKSVFTVAQGYKVTPGLFIEILGFKGKVLGGVKILETHAGIINNFTGNAKAQDIFKLSEEVISSVYNEFGVKLKVEPELVGDFKFIS